MKANIHIFNYTILAIVVLSLLIIFNNQKEKTIIAENLVEAVSDTLEVRMLENGALVGKILALETQSAKSFLSLNIKDQEIKKLQEEVSRYQKKLKEQGSVTIVETITKIDTIWGSDTIIMDQDILLDSINNEWIDITYGFIKGRSMFHLERLKNNYTIAVGREPQGLFKVSKPFVEITSYNPYTNISSLRTYNVQGLKPKKWGIGLNAGYGASINNGVVRLSPQVSIGLNYNLISW